MIFGIEKEEISIIKSGKVFILRLDELEGKVPMKLIYLVMLCLPCGCISTAQDGPPEKIDRTVSAQKAALRRAPQLEALSWMVGNWSYDVFTMHPDGTEEVWLVDQRREVQFERNRTWLRSDTIYPTQPLETQLNYLTFDLVEERWVSISFSNTGYQDIQFSEDTLEDGRLEFTGNTCNLSIAPDGCQDIIIKLSDERFDILSKRFDKGRWVAFSRSEYTRVE